MFKVLAEISESITQGQKGSSSLAVGGRVRSPEMKALLAKQLGQGLQSLEGASLVDLKTGRIQSKKAKKEKGPLQLALDELKKMQSKLLVCFVISHIFFLIRSVFWKAIAILISSSTQVEETQQWYPIVHQEYCWLSRQEFWWIGIMAQLKVHGWWKKIWSMKIKNYIFRPAWVVQLCCCFFSINSTMSQIVLVYIIKIGWVIPNICYIFPPSIASYA